MRSEDLGFPLSEDVRLVATVYGYSPNEWCRQMIQRAVDAACDQNQHIAELINYRH